MRADPSDHELVAETLSGNREGFSMLVRRYQAAVHAFVLSRVGDFEMAEDVAQETFVAAFLGLKDLREPERFGSWLRGIAANLSAAALRRRMRETRQICQADAAVLETARAVEPSPEELALRREREDAVLAALSHLTPGRAAAVTLFYSDGLSYRECAEFLDVNVSTVEARLHKARRQLEQEVLAMTAKTLKDRSPGEDFTDAVEQEIAALLGVAGGTGKLAPRQKALDKLELLVTRNPDRLAEMVKKAGRVEDLESVVQLARRCGAPVVRTVLPLVLEDDETVRRNALAALPRDLDGTYLNLEAIHDSDFTVEQRVELLLALLDRADELRVIGDDHWTGPLKTPRQPKHVTEQFAEHQQLYAEMLTLYEKEAYPRLLARAIEVFGDRRFVTFDGALANALCRFGDRCLESMRELLENESETAVLLALRVLQFFGRGWNDPRMWPSGVNRQAADSILSLRRTGEVTTGLPPIPQMIVSEAALDAAAGAVAAVLKADDAKILTEATAALADIKRPGSADALRQALQSRHAPVRAHAARGLAALGHAGDLETLVEILKTDDDSVRVAVSDALTRLSVDALSAAADARPPRVPAAQREQFAELVTVLDGLRPRIVAALDTAKAERQSGKARHPALSERGFWQRQFVQQLNQIREGQQERDRKQPSPGELARQRRLEKVRGGAANPVFYDYLPAAIRQLPEDREYHEVELTRYLSHGNYNYTLARRTLIVEHWMTRDQNVYRFTETGRRAWRMEKVLEQAAQTLCADGNNICRQ